MWSGIACIYAINNGTIDLRQFSVKTFFDMLLTTEFMRIYWFFIPLFMAYLSMPVLSYLAMTRQKYLWYMEGLGFVSYSIYPFLCNLFGIKQNSFFAFPLTSGYIIFIILGYLVSVTEFSKKARILIYVTGIGSVAIQYFGTYFLSMRMGTENTLFREYLNWPSVLVAISVFIWVKYRNWSVIKEKKILKVIQECSNTSLGIYLIHMYIINFICEKYNVNGYSIVWRTGGPFLVYIVSFILVKCIQKLPILKRIVP